MCVSPAQALISFQLNGLLILKALLAEGSRSLYAFARDGGLPFSHIFRRVEPKRQVPM